MTLKYESELLFGLMKREEESSSSDVLPYESELKEKYLNQVVGAYPKLQDYRPEWLYYNLYHHIPSDFPVESVANVTSASFYDVVPYVYKSAILKGNTLVNLISDGEVTQNAKNDWVVFSASINVDMIKTSTDYTLITYVISNSLSDGTGCTFGVSGGINDGFGIKAINVPSGQTGIYKIKLKTKDVFSEPPALRQQIFNDVATGSITFKQVLVEGDYSNQDIPYFDGMKSVQMPVLTTSNEDGTKTNILTVNEEVELRGIGDVQDTLDLMTGEVVERVGEVVLDGSDIAYTKNDAYMTEVSTAILTSPFSNCNIINPIMCDDFPAYMTNAGIWENKNIVSGVSLVSSRWGFCVRLPHTLTGVTTVDSEDTIKQKFKAYLQSNPITIQYQLATESIKTVKLSCINEQGESATFRPIEGTMHVNTSSQALPPLLDMSVPVEATTQNIMSFANIEEEE